MRYRGWAITGWNGVALVAMSAVVLALIAAMAATSSDAAVAKLGRARWQALHRTGAWYLWFVFAFTFVPDPSRGLDPLRAAAVAAFAAAPLVRAAAQLRTRRRVRAAA